MRQTLWIELGLVVALVAGRIEVAAADESDTRTRTITQCKRIDEAGSYVLGKNITATAGDLLPFVDQPGTPFALTLHACIVIAADFVGGHTIAGSSTALDAGIASDGDRRGVNIHSGVVTTFNTLIFMQGGGHTIANVRGFTANSGAFTVFGTTIHGGHRLVGNVVDSVIFTECPAVIVENISFGPISGIITRGAGCTMQENSPAP